MGEQRRKYPLVIHFNERRFSEVEIDSHYELKHPNITDQTILDLVRLLDGQSRIVEIERAGFNYCKASLEWQGKSYRIILTYSNEDSLGVINAFRVKEIKS